jgi:Protein of unknown function (DUF2628)
MKQYKVFKHPSGTMEAVKQGWSWPAFGFIFIWAMVKKMWGLGAGSLIGMLVVSFFVGFAGGGVAGDLLVNIVVIIVGILFGIKGNSWREMNLVARGYEQVDTVTAANSEGALALYLKTATT